jgi:DNA-directed RNA polymerase specialized sigma24 family protein
MTKKQLRTKNKAHLKLHRDFRKQYFDGTLSDSHPVKVKVKRLTRWASVRFGCPTFADDLEQVTVINLATKSKYRGESSLDAYILTMVSRSAAKLKQHPPFVSLDDDSDTEFPPPRRDTIANPQSSSLASHVLEKIRMDEFLAEVSKLPKIQQEIVDIILANETWMGARTLADELSKRLSRDVSRHEVQEALKRLRPLVEATLWVS